MEILLFILPFYLVGKWSIALARARRDARYGIALFSVTAIALGVICFDGYSKSQELAAQKLWTAASMSLGVSLVECGAILVLCHITNWILWPKK